MCLNLQLYFSMLLNNDVIKLHLPYTLQILVVGSSNPWLRDEQTSCKIFWIKAKIGNYPKANKIDVSSIGGLNMS